MNSTNLKRQASYTTVALVLIIVGILILAVSAFFSYRGNTTVTQTSQSIEATSGNIYTSLQDSANQIDSLLGKDGASGILLSAKNRVDTIASLNQSNPGSAEINDQLAILATELDFMVTNIGKTLDVDTQIKLYLLDFQTSNKQELSLLKQGRDNIGNGIFMIWGGFILLIPLVLILFSIRRNYFHLVDEFISQVEKYRNLLAVKKAVEVELQEANARVISLKVELEKAGIKTNISI